MIMNIYLMERFELLFLDSLGTRFAIANQSRFSKMIFFKKNFILIYLDSSYPNQNNSSSSNSKINKNVL